MQLLAHGFMVILEINYLINFIYKIIFFTHDKNYIINPLCGVNKDNLEQIKDKTERPQKV